MPRILLFNKPWGVLSQFTPEAGHQSLADFIRVPHVYPAGRLDVDSEGLLVLTDDGSLQQQLADPRFKRPKTYLVQVEGEPNPAALKTLMQGVELDGRRTLPCQAREVAEPTWLWPRNPPVRFRKSVPTHWLEIILTEGRNRQVRRMTAKVGLPTLRLIRQKFGDWSIEDLAPGTWRDALPQPAVRQVWRNRNTTE